MKSAGDRPKCASSNCMNLARHKGLTAQGRIRYGTTCHACHRKAETSMKYGLNNSTCQLCGWDKAPCDRHRFDPSLGYVRGNVISLCPNCHRLVTLGQISPRMENNTNITTAFGGRNSN